jgi:dTMP kinase
MPTGRGFLVTIEGGEGAGKSTQLARLAAWLEGMGLDVVRTREPGGTQGAEAIRDLLVEGAVERWEPLTELLLFAAARADHLARLIEPAIARGAIVLCDRYIDSTRVYQGLAGEVGLELVDRLHREVLGGRFPDLTILLDLPVATGLERRKAEGGGSRFEAKGQAYHERVRQGFLELARREPQRFLTVDAARGIDAVGDDVRLGVRHRLGLDAS